MGVIQEVNYTVAGGGPAPELGLKGVNLSSFPIINVSASTMISLGSGNSNGDRDRSYAIVDALSLQKGRHNLRMGGDYRRQMYNNYNPGKQPGLYTFSNSFSALPGSATTGTGFADLLLGLPTTTAFSGADYTYRMNINSAGAYIQDDFKVNSRLTLNLGLRWEYDGPYSEANGQFANFNPTLVNRTTGNPGEVVFAKINGAPSHFSPNIYHDVLPRVGFAWNALPKTILRGGYGVFRLPNIGYWNFGPISQYAVAATFTSLDNNITPVYQLSSGVPPRPYNVDANGLPNVPASVTKPTSTVTELETRVRTPYNQVLSLGIQRQITNQWFMEIDYVGNKGTKLPVVLNVDQLPPSQWGPGSLQALRPFPQYSVARYLANDGNSIYHSLQAKLEHQWKTSLMVSFAYTFSKLMDDVDPNARCAATSGIQNAYNLKAERGIGCYDVPQRFVGHYVYSVPLGRHGKWLDGTPVVKDLVSNWQVAGVTEFQTGQVMTISQTNNTNGFTNVQRPNQVAPASLPRDERTIAQWFNTSAFVAAPAYTRNPAVGAPPLPAPPTRTACRYRTTGACSRSPVARALREYM
jgi:hypothetical protein